MTNFLLSWVTKSLCSQAGSSPSPRTWLGPHRWDITFRVNATVSSLFILETGLEGIGKSVDSSSPMPPTLLRLAWRVKNSAQANEIFETQYLNLLTFFFLPSSNLSSDFSSRFLPTDDTVDGCHLDGGDHQGGRQGGGTGVAWNIGAGELWSC